MESVMEMKQAVAEELWVLGVRTRLLPSNEKYSLAEIVVPPGADGPPPHLHRDCSEMFYVVEGAIDVLLDGKWTRVEAGNCATALPNVVHTFRRAPGQGVVKVLVVINPGNFGQFFRDFGVPASQPGSQEASLAPDVVQQVLATADRYEMEFRLS